MSKREEKDRLRQFTVAKKKKKNLSCSSLIINTVSLVHTVQDLLFKTEIALRQHNGGVQVRLSFFQRLELERHDMQARYVVVIVLLWERLYFSTSSALPVFL